MRKYLINVTLIILVGILTIWVLMGSENPSALIGNLARLIPGWVLIGFGCIVSYWGFETLIQYLLVEKMQRGNRLWNCFKVVMTGHFFNAVTPFASGGQPMQAFLMVKQGISFGASASVLLSKFIIYQLMLTIYSAIVLILELNFFVVKVKGVIYLALAGFTVNLGVVIALVLAAVMKDKVKLLGFWTVDKLHRFHILHSPAVYKKKITVQIDAFNQNVEVIKKNTGLLISVGGLTLLQLTVYFLIPYTVYRALGLKGTEVFLMISAAAFIVMFASFIPIPGGTGVAEGSFFLLFQFFFPQSILPTAVLCWRIITFYVPLCIGGLVTILPNQKNKHLQMNIGA